MKDLQPIIDELTSPENGAELIANGDEKLGAVADMFISPETNEVAFRLLGPWTEMAYDRAYVFPLQDSLFQKDKNRVVLRSKGGQIYVLQPATSSPALTTLANFSLDEKQRKAVRRSLESELQ